MESQHGSDPKLLREEAYADDSHLDVRYRTHQLYTVDPVDFGRWTLERVMWRGDERVLDVGCGPGGMLCEMARRHMGWAGLVGFDFSGGMIEKAIASADGLDVRLFVGDAQHIPHPSSTFDVVMARHMLYHVPDIECAVAEAARVLMPGGSFLVTTNSANTMREYSALRQRAAKHFPAMAQPSYVTTRFSLEAAEGILRPYFEQIETYTLPGTLRFPSAQPFIDYFASARALTMGPDHSDEEWQAILEFVRVEVQAVIDREGHFDVSKLTGALVGIKRS